MGLRSRALSTSMSSVPCTRSPDLFLSFPINCLWEYGTEMQHEQGLAEWRFSRSCDRAFPIRGFMWDPHESTAIQQLFTGSARRTSCRLSSPSRDRDRGAPLHGARETSSLPRQERA